MEPENNENEQNLEQTPQEGIQEANPVITQDSIPQSGEIIGNYETDEQYQAALEGITKEVDDVISYVKESTDWKENRARLSDVKERLKIFFLKDGDNNRLSESINQCLELINARQDEERERYDKETHENYIAIKEKLEPILQNAKEGTDFRHSREILIQAQNEFKNVKLRRSQRDEFYNMINASLEEINQKQAEERENYEMECIENYHNMKLKVEQAVDFAAKSPSFAKGRETLINAQGMIKSLKLKRDQREELYQTIRDSFEALNKRQSEEREVFEHETENNYITVKKVVDDAIEFANTTDEYREAREQLINAQKAIKGVKLKREQRDELFAAIRAVFEVINEKQTEEREEFDKESDENYKKLTEKVDECFNLLETPKEFRVIRDALITAQSEVKLVKLKKEQRNELFARIREAFSIFDKKKENYFENKKDEKKNRIESIKGNLELKMRRLEESLMRDKDSLNFQNDRLNEANGNETLVADINEKIESIMFRMKEKEARISETKERLDDIDKEIAE